MEVSVEMDEEKVAVLSVSHPGQRVNFDKSKIYLSRNIHHKHKKIIKQCLKVGGIGVKDRYLGCPFLFSKSKVKDFQFLIDQMRKKLEGWKATVLSQAGREVMIKAVAQSMPVYTMSSFLLPQGICKEMDSLCRSFWWKGVSGSRALCLLSWDRLCTRKEDGGMGFRLFHEQNLALLAKLMWKLITDKGSLWSKVMWPRYKKILHSFSDKVMPAGASFIARGLAGVLKLVKGGAVWGLGDGNNTSFWNDAWLLINGEPVILKELLDLNSVNEDERVKDYLDVLGKWDMTKLQNIPEPVRKDICRVDTRRCVKDKLVWRYTKRGYFSVKTAYWAARNGTDAASTSDVVDPRVYKRLWHGSFTPHIKVFIWKCLRDVLPTADKLHRHHLYVDTECTLCGSGKETVEHLFFLCPWARRVWFGCLLCLHIEEEFIKGTKWFSFFEKLDKATSGENMKYQVLCFYIMYAIWCSRNEVKFSNGKLNLKGVVRYAEREWKLWHQALQWAIDHKENSDEHVGAMQSEEWLAPPPGWLKLNVDAAFDRKKKKGAAVVIARNSEGQVIKGASIMFDAIDAEEAELKAVEIGVNFAIEHDFLDIIIESDSANVVNKLNGLTEIQWRNRFIFESILGVKNWFRSVKFKHVGRDANTLAHDIAKRAWMMRLVDLVYYDIDVIQNVFHYPNEI